MKKTELAEQINQLEKTILNLQRDVQSLQSENLILKARVSALESENKTFPWVPPYRPIPVFPQSPTGPVWHCR